MTYTSPSTINASKGLGELLNYVNTITNQWISNLFLIGLFVIILIGYYKAKDDFAGALAVAGFGTFVAGLLFWLGGFVSTITFSVVIGVCLLSVIIILVDKNN